MAVPVYATAISELNRIVATDRLQSPVIIRRILWQHE
jgi:hypothetical protein